MQVPFAKPADLDVAQLRAAMERTLTDADMRRRAGEMAGEIAAMPSAEVVATQVEEALPAPEPVVVRGG